MKVSISIRNAGEHEQALREYVEKTLHKLHAELDDDPRALFLEVVVEMHPVHAHHRVSVHITYGNALLIVDQQGTDAHQEIAAVIEKAQERLHKEKERLAKREKE